MVQLPQASRRVPRRSSPDRRPQPYARVLALLLGLVVVLALASGCTPDPPPPPPVCVPPDPMPALVAGSLTLPAQPRVLILGDSYTEGYGAEPETKGWAYLVGKPLGWTVTVNGVGGTGYVNPGPHDEGTYLTRLPTLAGRTFDLVVVQGGSNDRGVTYPDFSAAVAKTIEAVRAEFPGATVVLMGPATPYGKPDASRTDAQCVLAGYAVQQHLAFIDPVGETWFVDGDGQRNANPANGHPSNAGYRRIAARFEADVRLLTGAAKPS